MTTPHLYPHSMLHTPNLQSPSNDAYKRFLNWKVYRIYFPEPRSANKGFETPKSSTVSSIIVLFRRRSTL
ncbi:Hypothetical protein FKW44_023938 [Caligus rogercresseyi]|uniref:Uncharacterized protein n=1 Tax=Caligus rogercresseyi TaxID=217165 RepID=A0A7T8GPT3_CALRO|nr:Hypothetical protein FKW44_023938 [Caligus rogercresseyi]